jgi:membrane protein YdbS with pleckstrin-like domain
MYDRLRTWVLHVMRVPHDPAPPFGAPGSIRVFRAGRNYFKLRLFGWGVAQLLVLAGIVFWAAVLFEVENTARAQKQTRAAAPPLSRESFDETIKSITAPPPDSNKKAWGKRAGINGWTGFKRGLVEIALRLPPWAFPLIWFIKLFGLALFLGQIPFTYMVRRLDYELRWYIVTDRSLRIRTGLVRLQESTMSFANLQQVEVKQGPLQRLLGLADVHVQSAGGGSGKHDAHHGQAGDSLHTGIFHSVVNATEIRDLILERLRHFRQAGLGDPDDHHDQAPANQPPPATDADTLVAAREILAEARALRAALSS